MRYCNVIMSFLLLGLSAGALQAQQGISVQKNLRYGIAPKGIPSKYYRFDLYRPAHSDTGRAPLIIMLHGGGFKLGSKSANSTPAFCRSFAERGWICASMNYRLSKGQPLVRFRDLVAGCFEAMEDLQTAIQYFKQHGPALGIDTGKIILAGNSAGAILAIQYVYANRDTLAAMAGNSIVSPIQQLQRPTGIRAIINCWGAIFDSSWLAHDKVPIVSIHGMKDRVVPFNFTDKRIFGSGVIDRQCAAFGIPHTLLAYPAVGHELQRHFNPIVTGIPARKRYREAAAFADRFLKTVGL